jgi:hypothetical protein
MPCRRQPVWGGAAAITLHPQSNQAPHMIRALWLHAKWRGKVEREEGTTAWCPPRSGPAGERTIPRLTVAARCVRSGSRASCHLNARPSGRGALPLHPMRGKDHSDAVVSPSRSFVPSSRRSKACELVRPTAGSAGSNASVVACRPSGMRRAGCCGVRERNAALPSIRCLQRRPGEKVEANGIRNKQCVSLPWRTPPSQIALAARVQPRTLTSQAAP